MHRVFLPAPEGDWFDRADTAKLLAISVRQLERLVEQGLFPEPVRATPRAKPRWSATDVAAYLHLRGRCRKSPDGAGEEES